MIPVYSPTPTADEIILIISSSLDALLASCNWMVKRRSSPYPYLPPFVSVALLAVNVGTFCRPQLLSKVALSPFCILEKREVKRWVTLFFPSQPEHLNWSAWAEYSYLRSL